MICLGYKQYVVKEFFADYFLHTSDVTFDLANSPLRIHTLPKTVVVIAHQLAFCRQFLKGLLLKHCRIQPFVGREPFMLTYGDGVCNVDLKALLKFHKEHKKTATITTVSIAQMKGVLDIGADQVVRSFREKKEALSFLYKNRKTRSRYPSCFYPFHPLCHWY